MEQITIQVTGMHCQKCVASVTAALTAVSGVAQAQVSLEPAQAMVTFDPERVDRAALCGAVEDIGFDAH